MQAIHIDTIINQPDTDISVSLVAQINNKYCFVIQPSNRWGKTNNGNDILFFGGIGGKVESGENLIEALKRETKEEVNGDITIIHQTNPLIPFMTKQQVIMQEIIPSASNPLPLFIYQNERSEPNRKKFTHVFSYSAQFTNPHTVKPIDNPAILLIPPTFLKQMAHGIPLTKAIENGVEMIANNKLPTSGILMPTPTPTALIQLQEYAKLR